MRKHGFLAVLAAWTLVCGCNAPGARPASQPAGRTGNTEERSVKPGINDSYKSADPSKFVERFEREGREIYDQRERIAADIGLRPGERVADIGAGTGLFTPFMSQAVGESGRVYAVDITPEFIEHIRTRANAQGWTNVTAVLCTERSTELAPGSIDAAFICDTYHHFEYPRSTMTSLFKALRPGGRVILIDFERIPGRSDAWILDHVRAGRETVIEEVESFGFTLDRTFAPQATLRENYALRFVKPNR